MGFHTGARTDRYVDREIVQRILKFLDAGVLFAASIFISLLSAVDPSATSPQVIGFLAVELSLVCVFAMRSFGLYDVGALTQGAWTALRATAISFILGGLLYLLTHRFLLEMDFGWMYLWMMVLPAYFGITRGAVSLWAAPRAAKGRFRQRVAIVGGGTVGRRSPQPARKLEGSRHRDHRAVRRP